MQKLYKRREANLIFRLEGKELKTFEKWNEEHVKTCRCTQPGAFKDSSGFRLVFSFSPTGFGMGIRVECTCGEFKDCTNIDNW